MEVVIWTQSSPAGQEIGIQKWLDPRSQGSEEFCEEFKTCWSFTKGEPSSSVKINNDGGGGIERAWVELMRFLDDGADFFRITNLVLESYGDGCGHVRDWRTNQNGVWEKLVGLFETGVFSALRTLTVGTRWTSARETSLCHLKLETKRRLAQALTTNKFPNLRSLAIVGCEAALFMEAICASGIPRLRSFSVAGRIADHRPVTRQASPPMEVPLPQADFPPKDVPLPQAVFPPTEIPRSPFTLLLASKDQHIFSQNEVPPRLLEKILESGALKDLRHLELRYGALGGGPGFKVLVGAAKSEQLPALRFLGLRGNCLRYVQLSDLVVPGWFGSLEKLGIDNCEINDGSLRGMLRSIVRTREGFALQYLDLKDCPDLIYDAGSALEYLVETCYLPQLRKLDLSVSDRGSGGISVIAVEALEWSKLPRLQTINLSNRCSDAMASAIVRAYAENESLTVEIKINWSSVADSSLAIQAAEYRDRNVRLSQIKQTLKEELTKDRKEELTEDRKEGLQFSEQLPGLRRFKAPVEDLKHRLKEVQKDAQLPWQKPMRELDEERVTSAKVFLCGYQEVGKTTLRKSLGRSAGLRTKFKWERRPNFGKEPRTRGIELAQIEKKDNEDNSIKLLLWDLAGQEEFHVLHGTFLPDLGLAAGKATAFVIVFRAAPFRWEAQAADLLYWLRFVASSSLKGAKRHVLIVLNCFNRQECSEGDLILWKALIKQFFIMFQDLLDIHPQPFVSDVRVASSVQEVKDHLFRQAGNLLYDVRVPRICLTLQEQLKGWSKREKNHQLPILSWEAFENGLDLDKHEYRPSGKALKAAARYLHEFGEIIYFSERALDETGGESRSLVVPDPEWFCRQVVGQLLLPKEMLEDGEKSVKVDADGSISIALFQAFFEHLLVDGTRVEDVISMLTRLGLCYRMGIDKILIPALVHREDWSLGCWSHGGVHWVMGRSLTPENPKRTAFPVTLFRRLQVDLAQDPSFGGRGDSGYLAGKSFSSFKVGGLLVLIQFAVDYSDPRDNRVDVLVKRSSGGADKDLLTMEQIDCICKILHKVERLCVHCCPGVTYIVQVIQPRSVAEKSWTMSERELMPVAEVKRRIQEHGMGKYTGWAICGEPVKEETLLSLQELEEVSATADRVYNAQKQDAAILGLLAVDSLDYVEEPESSAVVEEKADSELGHSDVIKAIREEGKKVRETVRGEAKLTRQHLQRMKQELNNTLSDIIQKQRLLVSNVQSLQSFSIQEKERSVPRYMFLSKLNSDKSVWITLNEAFKISFQLHLLCEARYEDGALHEVKDQEGIEIKKSREWLVKVSPWLLWSLRVAVLVAKVGGGALIPGLGLLIPDLPSTDGVNLANAVDTAATFLTDHLGESQFESVPGNNGSSDNPIDLKERNIAEAALGDLMRELGHAVFLKKIALRRVVFTQAIRKQCRGSFSF